MPKVPAKSHDFSKFAPAEYLSRTLRTKRIPKEGESTVSCRDAPLLAVR
jgi:hypothetical protein